MFKVDQKTPLQLGGQGVQQLQLEDQHQVRQQRVRAEADVECSDHLQGGEVSGEPQPAPQDREAGEEHRLAEGPARADGSRPPQRDRDVETQKQRSVSWGWRVKVEM